MDSISKILFPNGDFLGLSWNGWKLLGWTGNLVFFSRFIVQWYATEKKKQVVVPVTFWWLSITGALILLVYAIYQRDSVFIFAYAFTWIPYIRNLIIHSKHQRAHQPCPQCALLSPPGANFCSSCGTSLPASSL